MIESTEGIVSVLVMDGDVLVKKGDKEFTALSRDQGWSSGEAAADAITATLEEFGYTVSRRSRRI